MQELLQTNEPRLVIAIVQITLWFLILTRMARLIDIPLSEHAGSES